jgi:MFS family permease
MSWDDEAMSSAPAASPTAIERDLRIILSIQALRAFLYGFGSVLIGASLAESGVSDVQVGLVFTAMLAGMALSSVVVGVHGERWGRRRAYSVLLVLMGITGAVYALTNWVPVLIVAALTGTLSTDPNESGPITSLEQAMIGHAPAETRVGVFGRYNAIAYLAGAVGSLFAAVPGLLERSWNAAPRSGLWLLVFPAVAVVALVASSKLSGAVEAFDPRAPSRTLAKSRRTVAKLAALFAFDSFAGGFIVQAFLVFWFGRRFGASEQLMAVVFFVAGLLQAASSIAAGRLACRIGMLNTMVFTHLPSNVLLMLIPLSPVLWGAVALLLGRVCLSQMDVPARQAYVVSAVDPDERVAAAALTNTARYVTRPAGPVIGAALMQVAIGAPFLVAGGCKIVYDLLLFRSFRHVRLPDGSR